MIMATRIRVESDSGHRRPSLLSAAGCHRRSHSLRLAQPQSHVLRICAAISTPTFDRAGFTVTTGPLPPILGPGLGQGGPEPIEGTGSNRHTAATRRPAARSTGSSPSASHHGSARHSHMHARRGRRRRFVQRHTIPAASLSFSRRCRAPSFAAPP